MEWSGGAGGWGWNGAGELEGGDGMERGSWRVGMEWSGGAGGWGWNGAGELVDGARCG